MNGIKIADKTPFTGELNDGNYRIKLLKAKYEILDTVVFIKPEETAVLNIPAIQMRKATERPQVYDCGSSVKFDPAMPEKYPFDSVYHKFENLHGKTWEHNLGDGNSSQRVVDDLFQRLHDNTLMGHRRENYHLDTRRSYIEDGL